MATLDRRLDKDGKCVYRARVRLKGYPTQTATFPTLKEARQWAQMTEGAVREGRYFPSSEAKHHTVRDMLARYQRDVLPRKRHSTHYGQAYQLRWWEAQLGQVLLADLSTARIVECRDILAQSRSGSTVNRYLALLSHCLTLTSQEWGWLDDSPMRKMRRLKEPRGRVRFLSDEERRRLLAACQESRNPYLYTVTVLALATGARRGELLGLHWPDVNLVHGQLIFRDTKNGEIRAVPVSGFALDILRQHAKVRHLGVQLVFPNATGTRPLSIREAFVNAVQRAGITDFRFHDLRHSAASYLAMNGASLAEIAEILGHKTLSMVKRYAHLSEAHTRGVVQRMNTAIFGQ